ncbi:MAG: PilN domain-containing protein [Vicinamibacterales bacterium]
MIRINLLGQARAKRSPALTFLDPSQRVPLGAVAIVALAASGVGGWFWMLDGTSKRIDADTITAERRVEELKPVLNELKVLEERGQQLQQRVALIQQLRGGQQVPVQLLDAVSRAVPESLWLTDMTEDKNEMTIQGRSSTLIALSDFVGNLGSTGVLQKPVEIVSSQVETIQPVNGQGVAAEVIKFTVKAAVTQPAAPTPAAAPVQAPGGAR